MGKLLVLIGPSGAGKTTLANALDNAEIAVRIYTYTTRPRRYSEGAMDYTFVTEDNFNLLKEKNEFIETTVAFNHQYGTSVKDIDYALKSNDNWVIVMDVNGAKFLKAKYPEVIVAVVVPNKPEDCFTRLYIRENIERLNSIESTNIEVRAASVLKDYAECALTADVQIHSSDLMEMIFQASLIFMKDSPTLDEDERRYIDAMYITDSVRDTIRKGLEIHGNESECLN